jgi:hypothetical protein
LIENAAHLVVEATTPGSTLNVPHPNDISVKQSTASLMAAAAAPHKQMEELEKAGEYYRMSIEAPRGSFAK